MTEEGGMGFGTIVAALFIMIVILVMVFTNNELLGESKEVFEDTFDTQEAIDIFKDAMRDEQDRTLIELESVADVFDYYFDTDGRDCTFKIDTSTFSGDVLVEFREDNAMRVTKESFVEKIARRNFNFDIFYTSQGIKGFIIEGFTKITYTQNSLNYARFLEPNGLSFYKSSNGNLFLLNFDDALQLEGLKPDCNSGNINVLSSEGDANLNGFMNSDVEYLDGSYKVYTLLNYLNILNNKKKGDPSDSLVQSKIDEVKSVLGVALENYNLQLLAPLVRESENSQCWKITPNLLDISFGNAQGETLLYSSSRILLSNGLDLTLNLRVSKEGCLPATEIDRLLEPYRNVGAPQE